MRHLSRVEFHSHAYAWSITRDLLPSGESHCFEKKAFVFIVNVAEKYSCNVFPEECSGVEWPTRKDWLRCQYTSELAKISAHDSRQVAEHDSSKKRAFD